MDNIVEPDASFDFSKLTLAHPSGIQGGAYFTRLLYNEKPLYIQTTKSLTRQGFVKAGKKHYSDLMFDNNSETIINWFENLEEKCYSLLFDKREAWFQNSIDQNDIENAFTNIIRVYKSGKYYLIRSYVKNTADNEPLVKIYSENGLPLKVSDINPNTYIISILEIQGIKFTTKTFQVELELKQIMIVDNEPIFDSCVIKTKTSRALEPVSLETIDTTIETTDTTDTTTNDTINDTINDTTDTSDTITNYTTDTSDTNDITSDTNDKSQNDHITLEFEDLNSMDTENTIVMDVKSANSLETITLKKPNEVYYNLYRQARSKAKEAKKNAIVAYLEAKHIKKTHMLEIMNESDSDFDAEIEETSESELDGF